jgi:hypothetical protein
MLPYPDDAPAEVFELESLAPVTVEVLSEFRVPELVPRSRPDVVLWAAMPEASIDEDGNSSLDEHKIWRADRCSTVKPISVPALPQASTKQALRRRVAPANPRHLLRTTESHLIRLARRRDNGAARKGQPA